MADHGGLTTRPTSGPTTYPTSGGGTSGMSGPIVGHVGPDRRACRARSSGMSGMSGPIVGHVGPDRRACRARSSGMSGPTSGDRRVVGGQKLPFSASIPKGKQGGLGVTQGQGWGIVKMRSCTVWLGRAGRAWCAQGQGQG